MGISFDRAIGLAVVVIVVWIASLATAGTAGVRWRADLESQNLGQWDCGTQEKAPDRATIVSSPVRQGRFAARYEVRPGDTTSAGNIGERAESLSCRSFGEGEEQWWAWSTMFAPGFSASSSRWNAFTQWHNSGTSGGTLGFIVVGNELRFQSFGGDISHPTHRACKVADKTNGTWYDIVLHVKWSANPSVGFVEVWVNGKKFVELPKIPTLYNGQTVYLKQGYYRAPQPNVGVIYHDGMREGTSYSDVTAEFPDGSTWVEGPRLGSGGCRLNAPTIRKRPEIRGVVRPAGVLAASRGRWADEPTRFSYQWQASRDGSTWSNLRRATGRSLVLPATLSASRVRVLVTASNVLGSSTVASAGWSEPRRQEPGREGTGVSLGGLAYLFGCRGAGCFVKRPRPWAAAALAGQLPPGRSQQTALNGRHLLPAPLSGVSTSRLGHPALECEIPIGRGGEAGIMPVAPGRSTQPCIG